MGLDGKPFSSAFNKLANAKNAAEKPAAAPTPRPAGQAPAARPAGQAPAPSPRPAGLASAPSPRPAGQAPAPSPRPAGLASAASPRPAGPAPTPKPAAFAAKPASPSPAAAAPAPAPQLKSIDEIAKEVIRGNYGNGEERKRRLAAAGYNYEQVQKRVNEMLKK